MRLAGGVRRAGGCGEPDLPRRLRREPAARGKHSRSPPLPQRGRRYLHVSALPVATGRCCAASINSGAACSGLKQQQVFRRQHNCGQPVPAAPAILGRDFAHVRRMQRDTCRRNATPIVCHVSCPCCIAWQCHAMPSACAAMLSIARLRFRMARQGTARHGTEAALTAERLRAALT